MDLNSDVMRASNNTHHRTLSDGVELQKIRVVHMGKVEMWCSSGEVANKGPVGPSLTWFLGTLPTDFFCSLSFLACLGTRLSHRRRRNDRLAAVQRICGRDSGVNPSLASVEGSRAMDDPMSGEVWDTIELIAEDERSRKEGRSRRGSDVSAARDGQS